MSQIVWAILATLTLLVVLATVAPGFILRLLLLAYPCGHEQRDELIAELHVVLFWDRPTWILEQFETALSEGISERRLAARRKRSDAKRKKHKRTLKEVPQVSRASHVEVELANFLEEEIKPIVDMEELLKLNRSFRTTGQDGEMIPFDIFGPNSEVVHLKCHAVDSSRLEN